MDDATDNKKYLLELVMQTQWHRGENRVFHKENMTEVPVAKRLLMKAEGIKRHYAPTMDNRLPLEISENIRIYDCPCIANEETETCPTIQKLRMK